MPPCLRQRRTRDQTLVCRHPRPCPQERPAAHARRRRAAAMQPRDVNTRTAGHEPGSSRRDALRARSLRWTPCWARRPSPRTYIWWSAATALTNLPWVPASASTVRARTPASTRCSKGSRAPGPLDIRPIFPWPVEIFPRTNFLFFRGPRALCAHVPGKNARASSACAGGAARACHPGPTARRLRGESDEH